MRLGERQRKSFHSFLDENIRVACFSEKCNNMPMWAHYAKEHRGICFGYAEKDIDDCVRSFLWPVSYERMCNALDCEFHDIIELIPHSDPE